MPVNKGISRRRAIKLVLGTTAAGMALPVLAACRKRVPETSDRKPAPKNAKSPSLSGRVGPWTGGRGRQNTQWQLARDG